MKVDIRKTHPNLYRGITILAITFIALGINFILATPTFAPLNLPYTAVGTLFLALGVTKLIFLNFIRIVKLIRVVMAFEIGVMFVWAWFNTQQFWSGNASLQLPIAYMAISLFEICLLVEPAFNPVTEKPDPVTEIPE